MLPRRVIRLSGAASFGQRVIQETQLGARLHSLGTALVVLHRQETRNTGREMRAEIKSIREQRPRTRLTSRFPQFAQSSLASASRSHTDRRFSYHVSPEADDDLLGGSPCDLHTGMDDVAPGMHARPISRLLFETDPLRQYHSERVVDPSHFVPGLAIRNHVTHNGLHRLPYFNLQPASRFPRPSFAPVHVSRDVCKFIPSPPIRENFPGQLPAGLGAHTVLKSKHNLLSHTPVFGYLERSREGHFGFIIDT